MKTRILSLILTFALISNVLLVNNVKAETSATEGTTDNYPEISYVILLNGEKATDSNKRLEVEVDYSLDNFKFELEDANITKIVLKDGTVANITDYDVTTSYEATGTTTIGEQEYVSTVTCYVKLKHKITKEKFSIEIKFKREISSNTSNTSETSEDDKKLNPYGKLKYVCLNLSSDTWDEPCKNLKLVLKKKYRNKKIKFKSLNKKLFKVYKNKAIYTADSSVFGTGFLQVKIGKKVIGKVLIFTVPAEVGGFKDTWPVITKIKRISKNKFQVKFNKINRKNDVSNTKFKIVNAIMDGTSVDNAVYKQNKEELFVLSKNNKAIVSKLNSNEFGTLYALNKKLEGTYQYRLIGISDASIKKKGFYAIKLKKNFNKMKKGKWYSCTKKKDIKYLKKFIKTWSI